MSANAPEIHAKYMLAYESADDVVEFIDGDPFVQNGVVRNWSIREWNEALAN